MECPIFFLVQHFPILGNGIFCKNFGYSKISPLGISCLLMFKWSRKAIFSYFFLFCDIQLCFFTRTLGHRDCHLCEESFHGASAKRYLTNHMKKHTIKKESKYLFFYKFIPFITLSRVCKNIFLWVVFKIWAK